MSLSTRRGIIGAVAVFAVALALASLGVRQASAQAGSDDSESCTATLTGSTTVSYAENGTSAVGGKYRVVGSSAFVFHTWTLSGTDSDDFRQGQTQGFFYFSSSPDYENPTDADTDNVYSYTINVVTRAGCTGSLDVTVTVTDVNEAPVVVGIDLSPAGDTTLAEGSTETRTVKLLSQPSGPVTVSIYIPSHEKMVISPNLMTFTSENWNTGQSFTITTKQDDDSDDEEMTVSVSSSGAQSADTSFTVTIGDDD